MGRREKSVLRLIPRHGLLHIAVSILERERERDSVIASVVENDNDNKPRES